jgi:hypothetical protein
MKTWLEKETAMASFKVLGWVISQSQGLHLHKTTLKVTDHVTVILRSMKFILNKVKNLVTSQKTECVFITKTCQFIIFIQIIDGGSGVVVMVIMIIVR